MVDKELEDGVIDIELDGDGEDESVGDEVTEEGNARDELGDSIVVDELERNGVGCVSTLMSTVAVSP